LEVCGFTIKRQLTVSHFRVGLLKRIVPLRLLVALDSLAQYTGDWWQLSPSVFALAQAVGEAVLPPANGFFACPNCGGDQFDKQHSAMVCLRCNQRWEIREGIYIFR
ncbi:MAG: DUF2318 domain-containing protein, partial [Anaerolineales bacterium]|nr:DUF2318 domain-containing protein [Anaerolineales bacterium]